MMGFRFQDPLWLLLLIPLALLGWLAIRRGRRAAVLYSSVAIVRALPVTRALKLKRILPWVGMLAMAALIAALARPQHGEEEFRVLTEGIAIEMCVDRSGSMRAMDFELDGKRVNRLEAVKKVFADFVSGNGDLPGRADDQVGLVAFGGYSHDKCPLTLDHHVLEQILETVEIPRPMFDEQGRIINRDLWEEEQMTAIGDAVATAVERLKGVKAKSKVIILLSDGEQTVEGEATVMPADAARAAKAYGIKIYTIGIGSSGLAPMPVTDRFGRLVADRFGRIATRLAPVRLDEETLKMLAETTGGQYFNARNTGALQKVYAEIDQLEKTPSEGRLYTQYRELYRWFLFSGLGLVLVELLLVSTRFRSLP